MRGTIRRRSFHSIGGLANNRLNTASYVQAIMTDYLRICQQKLACSFRTELIWKKAESRSTDSRSGDHLTLQSSSIGRLCIPVVIEQRSIGIEFQTSLTCSSRMGRPTESSIRRHQTDHTWVAKSEERRVGKECRSRWSPYH